MQRRVKPIEERFWPKVDKNGPLPDYAPSLGPCWLWTAYVTPSGYGLIGVGRAGQGMRVAHRVVYELTRGPIPEGMVIDHLCRIRHCVNPSHLEVVTERVNILRGTGMSARHVGKSHCVNGHAYDAENTHVTPEGWRRCRECMRRKQSPQYETRQRAYGPVKRRLHLTNQ